MQRAEVVIPHNSKFGSSRGVERALGIYVNVGINFWIESFDAIEMSLDQFDWRHFFCANVLRHKGGRKKCWI